MKKHLFISSMLLIFVSAQNFSQILENSDFDDNSDIVLDLEGLDENQKNQNKETSKTDNSEILQTAVPDEDVDPGMSYYGNFIPCSQAFFNLSFMSGISLINRDIENLNLSLGIISSQVKNLKGVQSSTLWNISLGNCLGFQTAGILNLSNNVCGVQAAGIFNYAGKLQGLQAAPLVNIGKKVKGLQLSGLLNIADNVQGSQISGLFNMAEYVSGMQLGFVNIANKNDGLSIGLINIIDNGLFNLAFSWNSDDTVDFYLQSGTKKLYSILGSSWPKDDLFAIADWETFYFGLGNQLSFKFSSLQFELLTKFLLFDKNQFPYMYEWYDQMTGWEKFCAVTIPTFKFTWNIFDLSTCAVFLGMTFENEFQDLNDFSFYFNDSAFNWNFNKFIIHTSINAGLKLKLKN